MGRPKIAVHKFSSCDGCQLALLNLGESLLLLPEWVDIVHFVEAGPMDEDAEVDIALVEGSISTPEDLERIRRIREHSRYLIAIGACASSGGLQALRNQADATGWISSVYSQPQYIDALRSTTPIASQVRVDLALWGCPVSSRQLLAVLRDLLSGVKPRHDSSSLCMECKRQLKVCTLVTKGEPCMGPVTHAGCGAICPGVGRGCYACYGPAEQVNGVALAKRFTALGLGKDEVQRRFAFIHSAAEPYRKVVTALEQEHE